MSRRVLVRDLQKHALGGRLRKNHVGIDRTHGFVRRFTVTHAAAPDGKELGRLLLAS